MPLRVEVNQTALAALLRSPAGPTFQRIEAVAAACEAVAKRNVNTDEGRLRASIQHLTRVEGSTVVGTVGTEVEYAIYVHEGTGIYGPRGTVIRPVTARVLAFPTPRFKGPLRPGARHPARERRGLVFARWVRGTPKHPFLVDAAVEVSPWPVRMHPR